MYLKALVTWYRQLGKRRWFVVGERSTTGQNLGAQASRAIATQAGEVVGTAQVAPEQPAYFDELMVAREGAADLILLLIRPKDQIAFLAQ